MKMFNYQIANVNSRRVPMLMFFGSVRMRAKKLAEKVSQDGSAHMAKTLRKHESVVCLGLYQGN